MQDEMEDLMEMSAEVSETMSRSYGVPDELDEADLDAGKLIIFSVVSTFEDQKFKKLILTFDRTRSFG